MAMRRSAVEVHQDVVILRLATIDDEVEVDVFGSDPPIVGTVSYTFPDVDERRAHVETLQGWERDGTRLTYVRRGDEVALIDDAARFADAWEG
jgi:hypothetical protein